MSELNPVSLVIMESIGQDCLVKNHINMCSDLYISLKKILLINVTLQITLFTDVITSSEKVTFRHFEF